MIIVATNKTRPVSNVIKKKRKERNNLLYLSFVIEIFARILNTNIKA